MKCPLFGRRAVETSVTQEVPMLWLATAVERAMKRQEVILRALSGALSWLQAADILGIDPRSLRRWRARYEADQMIRLALQEAGLVVKRRARGRHRRRREPRACFGELLHLDGSPHAWLAHCPAERQTLIAVLDDATKRLLYAQLWLGETLQAVMHALAHMLRTFGLPGALYTDRAGWAFHTPKAGGPVDRDHLTQVGRALATSGPTRPKPAAAEIGRASCRERV